VSAAAAVVFFAYIGFDAVSTTAEEAKNPSRDLPIGIIASLIICTVLYLSVAAVLSGIVPVYYKDEVRPPRGLRVSRSTRTGGRTWSPAPADHERVLVMLLSQPRIFAMS
jgi:APA family basic amino acid/polyamine antiporter